VFGKTTSSQTRRSIDPALLVAEEGLRLRIQLLDVDREHQEWKNWPTEERDNVARYSDVPKFRLRVPTLDSFAAMKLAAEVIGAYAEILDWPPRFDPFG
jgi:hypothetical protein